MIPHYLHALHVGMRLSLLGRVSLDLSRLTPGMFWGFALAGLLLSCTMSYLGTEPPRLFVYDGILSEAFGLVVTLLIGQAFALAFARPSLRWQLPVLILAAGLLPLMVNYLAYDFLLPRWAEGSVRAYLLLYGLMQLWWVGILYQGITLLVPAQPTAKRLVLSFYAVGLVALLSYPLSHYEFWEKDLLAEYRQQEASKPKPLVAESVFGRQAALMERAASKVQVGQPGKAEMYFLGFAGDGRQKVFMRETRYIAGLFDQKFDTAGRSLVLANDRDQVEQQPMASVTNLGQSLKLIAQRMNVEEDILFLYLTSHGSKTHELAVVLDGIGLLDLSAAMLARLLRESGVRWRVVVVSACYSGGFIDPLKDDTTMVITAARADRKSFGCSDTADFTYFGRAYFEQALNQTDSFTDAFRKAKALVHEWELRDKQTPSEPQIHVGSEIKQQLAVWDMARQAGPEPAQAQDDVMLESDADVTEQSSDADPSGL